MTARGPTCRNAKKALPVGGGDHDQRVHTDECEENTPRKEYCAMMKAEDDELENSVGPGTAMGNLFGGSGLPVMLISEVAETRMVRR